MLVNPPANFQFPEKIKKLFMGSKCTNIKTIYEKFSKLDYLANLSLNELQYDIGQTKYVSKFRFFKVTFTNQR